MSNFVVPPDVIRKLGSPSEPLRNVRQERFCLALAEGMSATSAYLKAGYKQSASATANAARLITSDNIKARLAHLQAMAAKASEDRPFEQVHRCDHCLRAKKQN